MQNNMQKNSKLQHSVRTALGVSCGALLLQISPMAFAQEAQQTPADEQVEKIAVTGTRIKRTELVSNTPVVSFSAEDIVNSGKTNIEDLLSVTPALVGSTGSADTTGGGLVGANFLNLRNLGTARTLVLINGRRHVGANELGSASVDTQSIPMALVKRIDITTGGASAVYGADGVSGVVNFVMMDDFEGTKVSLQGGQSRHGDADELAFSFVTGNNFADDDANLTFAYEYSHRGGLRAKDRDYLSSGVQWYVNNPAEIAGDVPGEAAQVLSGNIRDVFVAADGLIDPFGEFSNGFRGNDPLDRGNNVGSPGAGVPSGTIGGNSTEMWRIIRWGIFPEQDRHTFSLLGKFDLTNSLRVFGDAKYSYVEAEGVSQSTYTILNNALADNPFLPSNVAAAAATVGAGTPGGPPIMYSRFDIDTGGKFTTRETGTTRVVLGLEGDITDALSFEVSLNYGQSDVTREETLRYDDRYFAALDAVLDPASGKVTCRSNLDPAAFANTPVGVVTNYHPSQGAQSFTPGANSGCVAMNPFVDNGATNAQAYDWIFFKDQTKGKLTQTVFNAFVSGDTGDWDMELPGGPLSFVLGAEYRKEKSEVDFPTSRESGPIFRYDAGVIDQSGDFDVTEVFAELSLPIFSGAGVMLEELTLNSAVRFADYSTIGNATTWEVGLAYAPIEDIRLRASLSQAIRAPNINELFSPKQPASFLPVDPCDRLQQGLGSEFRATNCAKALGDLGLTNDLSLPSTAVNFPGTQGGNPDLKAEEADTFTVGLVLQPSFAEGLSLTLDYYDIEINDGIVLPDAQNIVNACYDAPTLDNPFCDLLGRAANGDLNSLSVSYINVAAFKTSGIDFGLLYGLDLGSAGDLGIRLSGGFLDKLDIQTTSEPVFDDEKGETGTLLGGNAPEFILNGELSWQLGDIQVAYSFNHHDALLRVENEIAEPAEARNPYKTDAYWEHNIRFSYQFNDSTNAYFGVRNLTDAEPEPNSTALPIAPIGRFVYAGISLSTDALSEMF